MAEFELINESNREFEDISNEEIRKYVWSDDYLIIEEPQWLHVSGSGHYVVDIDGDCFFIPWGWLFISWRPWEGEPHIIF